MVGWEQTLGSSWRGKAEKAESHCAQCLAMKAMELLARRRIWNLFYFIAEGAVLRTDIL